MIFFEQNFVHPTFQGVSLDCNNTQGVALG